MRALACLATVVCLVLSPLTDASGQVTVGVQAGLSIAKIGGRAPTNDLHSRKGIAFGAFVEKQISDMLSFQPEILYIQKGAKDSDQDVDVTLKLDYMEIPLLLKVNVPTEGDISPYLLVGPALSFKAGCTISGEEGGVSVDLDCDEDFIVFKSFDVGGVVGAGVGFPEGSGTGCSRCPIQPRVGQS